MKGRIETPEWENYSIQIWLKVALNTGTVIRWNGWWTLIGYFDLNGTNLEIQTGPYFQLLKSIESKFVFNVLYFLSFWCFRKEVSIIRMNVLFVWIKYSWNMLTKEREAFDYSHTYDVLNFLFLRRLFSTWNWLKLIK